MGSSVILPAPGQPKTGPDPAFKTAAIPNLVSFGLERVGPPSPLYVQRDDQLEIKYRANGATGPLIVRWRELLAPFPRGGQPDAPAAPDPTQTPFSSNIIEPTEQQITVIADRLTHVLQIPLTEGYLISLTVQGGNNTIPTVNLWVTVQIFRGTATANTDYRVLFAGYVYNNDILGWPEVAPRRSTDGVGQIRNVQVANPGAGVDWVFTVPTGARSRFITVNADLTVANSGAARPVEIIVDDGVNVLARMATNATAPINATAHVNFSNSGTPSTSITSDLYAQMPATLVLLPTMRVRSLTTNIVAGDSWTNIWFLVEEWFADT